MGTTIIVLIVLGVIGWIVFKSITNNSDENISVTEDSKSKNIRNEVLKITDVSSHRKKSTTTGKFEITGYKFLSPEVQTMIWKTLKVGDSLILIPDPKNKYDSNAIKVMFKDAQIGWFASKGYRQKEIFDILMKGKTVKAFVLLNNRIQDNYFEDNKVKYRGMIQYVKAKFEYEV